MLRVAKREVISMLRDGRFRAASLLVMVLLGVAAIGGWMSAAEDAKLRHRAMHDFREEWLGQDDKNPHTAAHFGTYILKPSHSLSGLEPGLDPYIGRLVFLQPHIRNDFMHRPATESTPLRQFGFFTASFIMLVLAPLLIILFGYASFAGERETGTLRQSLASGARPWAIMGGKMLGVLAGLMLLLTPAAVLSAISIAFAQSGLQMDRILVLIGGYLLYFLAFVGITLFASAFVKRSQIALVALLGFWAISTFVVPRIASDLASGMKPLPSKAEFVEKVRVASLQGVDAHNPYDERRKPILDRLLKKYNVSRVEDLPVNFNSVVTQVSEEYTSKVYEEGYRELAETLDAQSTILTGASVMSPLIAMRDWSMAAAGTDVRHHFHFSSAAERYRQIMNRTLNDDLTNNSSTEDFAYTASKDLWAKIPAFSYEEPPLAWSVAGAKRSLTSLLLWACLSLGLAGFAAMRIRP